MLVRMINIIAIVLLLPCICISQYAVSEIPEDLTKNANIVVRESNTSWKVSSANDAVMKMKEVVTFLNSDAKDHAYIVLPYDDFQKIKDISIKLYDKDGKKIDKVSNKLLLDINMSQGFEINDTRAKILDMSNMEYPFTYVLDYEVHYKGLLSLPSWQPIFAENVSVQNASISLKSKKGYEFKFKTQNLEGNEEETDEENIISWSVQNLAAIKDEPYSRNWEKEVPALKIAPLDFELDGYKGSMRSWNDFGIWYNKLLDDTQGLNPEMEEEVKGMIDSGMSDLEKTKLVYKYLQDNTRYVSIQLGIGGFKPFDAYFTHSKKYGDCKALSYYTQAMLESVGVESSLVLVNAGRYAEEVDADFPSNQFNHLFLCVPQEKDSIWLECTSQTAPFGYLGHFTSDRNVLVINDGGAKLVRTPKYDTENNQIITSADIQLESTGAGKGTIEQEFKGLEFSSSGFSYFYHKPKKEQEEFIKDYYDIKDFNIESYTMETGGMDDEALGTMKSEITARKLGSTVGKRLFFIPIVADRTYSPSFENPENRENTFSINNTFSHSGTYTFNLPTGYEIEKNIKETNLESKFGTYAIKVVKNENGILIIERKFELINGIFPANEFLEFADFLKKISKADEQKVVLVLDKEP